MKANTTLFGEMDVNPETIITFPRGLPGLENCTKFQLVYEEHQDHPVVFYMQSLDNPAVAFSVVDPATFGLNYEFVMSDEETALVQSDEGSVMAVVLIVYKPMEVDGQKVEIKENISANVNGPLVLNLSKKLGMQKVLVGPQVGITLRG